MDVFDLIEAALRGSIQQGRRSSQLWLQYEAMRARTCGVRWPAGPKFRTCNNVNVSSNTPCSDKYKGSDSKRYHAIMVAEWH